MAPEIGYSRDLAVSCNIIELFDLADLAQIKDDNKITEILLSPKDDFDAVVEYRADDVDVKEAVEAFANRNKNKTFLFSDAIKNKNGARLARYITKNRLGRLIATPPIKNTTGNKVRHWMWIYNGKELPYQKCKCD